MRHDLAPHFAEPITSDLSENYWLPCDYSTLHRKFGSKDYVSEKYIPQIASQFQTIQSYYGRPEPSDLQKQTSQFVFLFRALGWQLPIRLSRILGDELLLDRGWFSVVTLDRS